MNGSDAERSKREIPTQVGDPELTGTVPQVGSEPTVDGTETLTYSLGAAIDEVQRFRVLRPHAQGGLGAVFVALDTELNREVALKQILDRHADDQASRSRFLLEAEITGGLEHPGIVPVYGMGVYKNGRPYYAMRFIRGDSLKEAIGLFHVRSMATAATEPATPEGDAPAGPPRRFQGIARPRASQAAPPVPRRLQCGRLRPFARSASSRHQAGQHHPRQAWRDTGRRLGAGEGDRQGRCIGGRADDDAVLGQW